ncbi:MAG TPA: PTS glucitol/sorbitol transporter subunit IIA [Ktedonobacteraceae bacterium]
MADQFDAAISTNEEPLLLKYRAVIQEIGPMVHEFLPHGILIFFGGAAPAELREVALVHDGNSLADRLAMGDILQFIPPATEQITEPQPIQFRLTAIGEVASENLAQLGHVVVHFDAASTANLPGAISVEPSLEYIPTVGTTIEIIRVEKMQ